MHKRKWTNIQRLELEILQMRNEGRTRQQIADTLGLEKEQIKEWIKRYNRRQRNPLTRKKGRPRSRTLSDQESMQVRIRELEREVDLYRSFLQAVGRR